MERPQVVSDIPEQSVPGVGRVRFFKGSLKRKKDPLRQCYWAVTDFGVLLLRDAECYTVKGLEPESVPCGELLASVYLEDLDRENIEFIVANLLAGNYLDRPGIGERDDSLLFVLVNEALHRLRQVEAAEDDLFAPTTTETPAAAD
jgi:hypothetical protein